MMEFLSDANILAAVDVITFVREVMQTQPSMKAEVLRSLLNYLKSIKSARVRT